MYSRNLCCRNSRKIGRAFSTFVFIVKSLILAKEMTTHMNKSMVKYVMVYPHYEVFYYIKNDALRKINGTGKLERIIPTA